MARIKVEILQCIMLFSVVLHAQEFLYRKVNEKDTTKITVTIRHTSEGYSFKSEGNSGSGNILENATLTTDGTVLSYSFLNDYEQYEVKSRLENGVIQLSSKRKGKEVNKTLKPKLVWRQVFPYDLTSFVKSSNDTLKFESIALYGPAALGIGGMQVVKLNDEAVVVNGVQHNCLHVRIALAGLLARFWHADYWFRKSDGIFIKGIWVEKSGAKPSVVELVDGP